MTKREYKDRRITIWPIYIDSSEPRGQGRRLPLGESVRKPRVEEILEAAEELGLNPERIEASYPRKWWSIREAVLVDKKGSKREILRAIASKIRENRLKH